MANEHILVVDDEEEILELVEYNLAKVGYHVFCVNTGEKALEATRTRLPDLIILDLMLPGIDGLDVCKAIKNNPKTQHIPIVMLTAKGEESDIVIGLELGADDYITKPFSPRVLIARLKTVLRRKAKEIVDEDSTLKIHDVTIIPERHEVLLKGKTLQLTATEFRVLHFMARRPGWVFTRGQIVDSIHGYDYPVTDRSIDVQIAGLRKKLGSASTYIETVRGVGYRFKE
jgi:two-component system phosphate regulon response regulator PhoB